MQIVVTTSLATFLISLINHTFASHVYSLTVNFIAEAIFLSPQCSASHTHTLSVSFADLLSFSLFPFDIRMLGKPFQIIIDYNKLFPIHIIVSLKRFAHNNTIHIDSI
jgi:hypothetical protein